MIMMKNMTASSNETNEKICLLHIISNPDLIPQVQVDFFSLEIYQNFFKLVKQYYKRFNEMPKNPLKTFSVIVKKAHYNGEVSQENIKNIFSENIDDYDKEWRDKHTKAWIKTKEFNLRLINGIEYVKTHPITPETVDDVINKTTSIINETSLTLDEDMGIEFNDLDSHYFENVKRISSGKVFVDKFLSGGYKVGTLTCYLGEQGVGKSLFLCNDAAHFCRIGENVIYISAEMGEKDVLKRIGANLLNIPINKYEARCKDREYMKNKMAELNPLGTPLGKIAIKQFADPTIPQIVNFCRKKEKIWGEKAGVIIIDYIGITSNYRNPNTENTYVKLKQISKDFRDACVIDNWRGLTAMQIGKSSWNKSSMTIEAIAESAGLAHNCDLIYGIIQNEEMHVNLEYFLKILKMRDGAGKNYKRKFKLNSKTLNVKECLDSKPFLESAI